LGKGKGEKVSRRRWEEISSLQSCCDGREKKKKEGEGREDGDDEPDGIRTDRKRPKGPTKKRKRKM